MGAADVLVRLNPEMTFVFVSGEGTAAYRTLLAHGAADPAAALDVPESDPDG